MGALQNAPERKTTSANLKKGVGRCGFFVGSMSIVGVGTKSKINLGHAEERFSA